MVKKKKTNKKKNVLTKRPFSIIINLREKRWELSSVGRASALQAGGHRFEPYSSHHFFVFWPGSSVG